MDNLLETISLNLEESNELLFKVKIEGADPSPAKVRLVCEGGDCSYMFDGKSFGDDVVQFNLPSMEDKLKEGLYQTRVEVLIENRYFVPVKFQINYKKSISVVVESINVKARSVAPEVTVSAQPMIVPKEHQTKPISQLSVPLIVENKPTLKGRYGDKKQQPVSNEQDQSIIRELVQSFMKEKTNRKRR